MASYITHYVRKHKTMPPECKDKKTFQCQLENCGYLFLTEYQLKLHVKKVHATEKRSKGPYKQKFRADQHNSYRMPGSIPCPHCNRPMVSDQKLQSHIKMMHGEKLFECSDCGKGFTREKQIELHLKNQKFHCKDGSKLMGPNTTARIIRKQPTEKDVSDYSGARSGPLSGKSNRGKTMASESQLGLWMAAETQAKHWSQQQ